MEATKKLARIDYWHGAMLTIDGTRVLDDLNDRFGDLETGQYDCDGEIALLREHGVTHVLNNEVGDGTVPWDHEYTLDEYAKALKGA